MKEEVKTEKQGRRERVKAFKRLDKPSQQPSPPSQEGRQTHRDKREEPKES